MPISGQQVWNLYSKYIARRRPWESLWEELARFEFPRRLFNIQLRSEGERQTDDLFDSTAPFANEILQASIQSGLTNQAIRWFTLKTADPALMADDEVKEWLEDSTDRMLAAISGSNFGTEASEMYLDLGVFGIGSMFMGEHTTQQPVIAGNSFRGLRFEAIPIGSYVIDEDGFGRVNTIIYRILMSGAAIAQRWGVAALAESTREKVIKAPAEDIALIHGVFPKSSVPGAKTTRPFTSIWLEEKTKHVIDEGGFNEFPFVVPRWAKTSGEPYGRGPGFNALPFTKTLNKTIELNLNALEVAIKPPVKARQNSVIGAVDLSPGGLTIMRDIGDMEEYITRANFNVAQLSIQNMQAEIRRIFFVDQLLQLLARETPMMTATEVAAKMQLLREILGPIFTRLESEFLNPMIDRVFALMFRAGAIAEPPDVLSDQKVEVDYESPIGLAKRGQELTAIDRVTLKAQELVGMGKADVLDNLDDDEIIRITAEVAGAPQKILRNRDERDAIRQQRQKAEQTQMLMAALQQGSEVAKNVAPLAKVTQEAEPPAR